MQDIIDLLKEKAIPQTSPLELPEDDDLVEVEEEILLPIPYEFKNFLLQVSDLVCGSLEPVTVTDPQAHTHLPEVAAQAWDCGLERDMLPICQSGDGYYCINQNGEVYFWQDGELTDDYWADVWRWAENVWLDS